MCVACLILARCRSEGLWAARMTSPNVGNWTPHRPTASIDIVLAITEKRNSQTYTGVGLFVNWVLHIGLVPYTVRVE